MGMASKTSKGYYAPRQSSFTGYTRKSVGWRKPSLAGSLCYTAINIFLVIFT